MRKRRVSRGTHNGARRPTTVEEGEEGWRALCESKADTAWSDRMIEGLARFAHRVSSGLLD
eukprot:scaffold135357_cov30-Tisochrysis_lutea.AAC.2